MKKPTKTTRAAKPTLPAAEWAFHRVPVEEWEAATRHEYEREYMRDLGSVPDLVDNEWARGVRKESRNLQTQLVLLLFGFEKSGKNEIKLPIPPPWLSLGKKQRAEMVQHQAWTNRMLTEQTPEPLVENPAVGSTFFSLPQFREEIAFHVDWRAKDEAIERAFRQWLSNARTQPYRQEWTPPKAKTGPRSFVSELVDLVIFRARRAGYTMKQTCDLMMPFLQESGGIGKAINPIQRARACQKAERKIYRDGAAWFLGCDNARAVLRDAVGDAPPIDFYLLLNHARLNEWAEARRAKGHFIPYGTLCAWEQTGDLKRLNSRHLTELRKRNRGK